MRDLYAQLGIDRTANAEEIAASARQRPDLEDSASILLDAGKRAVYDRAHANLKLIAELRRRLHLDSGDSWFTRNHADFAAKTSSPVPASPPEPAAPEPGAAESAPIMPPPGRFEAVPEFRPQSVRPFSARFAFGIILALAVLGALAYFWYAR